MSRTQLPTQDDFARVQNARLRQRLDELNRAGVRVPVARAALDHARSLLDDLDDGRTTTDTIDGLLAAAGRAIDAADRTDRKGNR